MDITKRKEQEDIIFRQLQELEIKNKELEQFAYIASHDLQEPLRTVSNYLNILKEDYEKDIDEEGMSFINTIERATDRMKTLVKALLDFSRLGRDKVSATVDCNELIGFVVHDLNDLITKTKSEITLKNLPTCSLYTVEFRQLIQNLLTNAIKFRKNGIAPKIEISAIELEENEFQFSIKDNGIGINKKYHEKVFHIFQRLDAVSQEGYGIGLAKLQENCRVAWWKNLDRI